MSDFAIYNVGLCRMSVCAPKSMTTAEVEHNANSDQPTGIRSQWTVLRENFATGETNPCPCNDRPNEKAHWLLGC